MPPPPLPAPGDLPDPADPTSADPGPFPGGVGISHLRVYDWEGPDGLRGGTPHVHTVCSEAYLTIGGSGRVQTLTAEGFGEFPLERGGVVWFSAGTVHRLINDGDLELFVVMSNSGLPEAGDLVITFARDVLSDPDLYARAALLPEEHRTTAGSPEYAQRRRDAGVSGFWQWVAEFDERGPDALADLHALALARVEDASSSWAGFIEAGPLGDVDDTLARLHAVTDGDPSWMAEGAAAVSLPTWPTRRFGCCGTIGPHLG